MTAILGSVRRRVAVVATALVAVGASACGVPTGNDTFDPIENADVPFNLAAPSTTTSTTTSTVPPTTVAEPSTTVENQPTTVPVSLYYVLGDELLAVEQETISQFTPTSLIDLLAIGPDPATSPGLETLVDDRMVNDITVRAGVATVDLDEARYDRVLNSDKPLLFGQIVLTLTVSGRTIGAVQFSFDGVLELAAVPNNRFKRNVTFDDYVELIANVIVVPESTTTTTVPPTSTTTASPDQGSGPLTSSVPASPPATSSGSGGTVPTTVAPTTTAATTTTGAATTTVAGATTTTTTTTLPSPTTTVDAGGGG